MRRAGAARSRSPTDRRSRRPGPAPSSVLTTVPPPSSSTTVRPLSPGRAVPVSTTAPVKSATNAERGRAASSEAVPSWTTWPRSITPTRSPSCAASEEVVCHEQGGHLDLAEDLGQLARGAAHGCGRPARTAARRAAAPAAGARARAPAPPAAARRRRACAVARRRASATPKRSSNARALPAPLALCSAPRSGNATLSSALRCGKSANSWNR